MEQEVRCVLSFSSKALLLMIVSHFYVISMNGQTSIPYYTGDDLGHSGVKHLVWYLGSVNDSVKKKIYPCVQGFGLFTFEVTDAGVAKFISFEGDLPEVLIDKIHANILSTSGKWRINKESGQRTNRLPFVFPFVANVELKNNCAESNPVQNKYALMGLTFKKIFKLDSQNDPQVLVTDTANILPTGMFVILR
jgi:hypothetical protein